MLQWHMVVCASNHQKNEKRRQNISKTFELYYDDMVWLWIVLGYLWYNSKFIKNQLESMGPVDGAMRNIK